MDFSQLKERYSLHLDPQQEAAVQAVDGPVLLLAVPGSGKTTVLVARLGYMCHVRSIPPEQILTMTYTVTAARDMRARYASLFGAEEAERLAFHTINSVCSRIIRYYERVTGRTAFRLLEDGGQRSAILSELYRSQTNDFATESIVRNLETAITYAKNQMLKGEGLSEVQVEGLEFPALYQSYCKTLRERHLMDFDDQMVYALQILRQYPQILQAVQASYRWFCVDEAQDTSKIQHIIIRLLAGKSGNLFMVGDEDQSIYGFRAACPQALTEFDAVYPNARVLYMERNYRSTEQIVAAADRFIQKNRNRRPKQMKAARGKGPEIRELSVYDRQEQYSYLCKAAQNCLTETAVLYRDNDSALPLIDLLDRAGISYRCRQVESLFFTSRVVRDITDIIRFALNPEDGALFLNIYYKLGAGISRILAQEAVRSGGNPLEYIIFSSTASPWTKKQCKALLTHMTNLLQERGDKAVYRIVHFMGYGGYWEERGGDLHKAEILEALGAQVSTPGQLLDRLEELRSVIQAGSPDAACPFVLSTIHSSKGLEYDKVILMDVADGLLPKILPEDGMEPEELDAYEEERRLFYVGMTRARRELSIFTFRKVGLESVFSREIFPKKAPKAVPVKKKLPHNTKQITADRIEALSKDYIPGTRLLHKAFGPGTLVSKTGDIIVVSFDSQDVKKIALSTALRANQLKLE